MLGIGQGRHFFFFFTQIVNKATPVIMLEHTQGKIIMEDALGRDEKAGKKSALSLVFIGVLTVGAGFRVG